MTFVNSIIYRRSITLSECELSFELSIHTGTVEFTLLDVTIGWKPQAQEYDDLFRSIQSNDMRPEFAFFSSDDNRYESAISYIPADLNGYMLIKAPGIKIYDPVGRAVYQQIQQMFLSGMEKARQLNMS